jgi:hypothetical protein
MMQELSLNILDLAQNAVTAGAGLIAVTVDEQPAKDLIEVVIADDGCGMTPEVLSRVTDPFYTTRKTRPVGLGLPFFKMAALQTGGSFEIRSEVGRGTTVRGVFGRSHIDRMPLGDLSGTIRSLIYCNPELDFRYTRRVGDREFVLDTREMRRILGDIPLNSNEVTVFIIDYLKDGESEISTGAAFE